MRLKSLRPLFVLCGLVLLILPGVALAQTIVTGALSGTVLDPSGASVAGATLTLKSVETGAEQTTTSNNNGFYQFPLLKPGTYTLTTTQSGFKPIAQNVQVTLGQTTTVQVKMELGAGTTTVEVTGTSQILQTQDANISTNFDTHLIENIPNPGNDLTYVAQTAPGVEMNTSSTQGYGNFSAFGLPGTANLFTINGNDYNDPFLNLNNSGASNLLLGTNDVQETSVVENGYTGQYGRQAGAQIDYSTKSGTNDFHGNAIYYWTGRALDANDWFLKASGQPRPFQNNNQWAASVGGPIKKNKAFFFLDTEGIRYTLATSSSAFLPTPAFQSFVLGQPAIAGSATNTAFYNQIFNLYNHTPGIANATPVAGGGCASAATLPGAPGTCLETFNTSASAGNQEWLLIGRADYNFNDNNKIFGRVKFDRGTQPTYADPINPAFDANSHQPQDEGQLNYTHVFSPNVVNNFIFSDLWYSAIFAPTNLATGLSTFPEILCSTDTTLSCLGPTGGEFPFAFFFPQGRNVEQWQLVDDLSVTRGNHNLKMGFNWRRDDISDYSASELTEFPAISTSLAGFATDAVALPVGPGGSVEGNVSQHFAISGRQPIAIYSFGLYMQDQWRIRPNLTVTLTLRADRNSAGVCQSNCASRPAEQFNLLNHDPTVPYNQMELTGLHQILPTISSAVWQPRVGFAWSPASRGFVVRGGVGMFGDLYPGTLLGNITTNFPEVNSWAVPGGTINPAETTSAAALVGACNSAFQTNFTSGGTLGSYLATAPAACTVTPNGTPSVPQLFSPNNNIRNPIYVEWNLEVQKAVGPRGLFSINYVGNHGYDEFLINPYVNGFCGTTCIGAGFPTTALPTTAPDARVAGVQQITNGGDSNYQGLTVSFQEGTWHGVTGRLNYTYSHATDVVSNGGILPYSIADSIGLQINPINSRLNYGPADYDARHSISFDYVWTLPSPTGHHLLNEIAGGWQISGTAFWRTGLPFSIVDGATAAAIEGNNLTFNGLPQTTILLQPSVPIGTNFGAACAENFANSLSPSPRGSTTPCFTAADFTTPANFVGTAGRNFFRGPRYFNTDISLRKTFKITERYNFQIGANAFNILNHVSFQNPSSNNLSGTFGFITAAVSPPTTPYGAFAAGAEDMRILQIVGKIIF